MGGVFVLIEPVDVPRSDGHKGVGGEVQPVETKSRIEMSTDFPET
jgi:hypothetical protein